jgi:hypothetical protein
MSFQHCISRLNFVCDVCDNRQSLAASLFNFRRQSFQPVCASGNKSNACALFCHSDCRRFANA